MPKRSEIHEKMEQAVLDALRDGPKYTSDLVQMLVDMYPERTARMQIEVIKRMTWKGQVECVKLPRRNQPHCKGAGYRLCEDMEKAA